MTESINPASRGGFYMSNGFEMSLPVRAIAKNINDLCDVAETVGIETGLSSKLAKYFL